MSAFKHLTTVTFRSVCCSQWQRNWRTNEFNHAYHRSSSMRTVLTPLPPVL